jgi:phospholipid/cholesterol/gamma-HCH transport system substrate-binding protein
MSTLAPPRLAPRRRQDEPPPWYHLATGIATIAVLVAIAFIAARAFTTGVPGFTYPVYDAVVPNAAGLRVNDDVRAGGVKVGEVKDVIARGREALIEFKLMYALKSLPAGTQALVRPVGLLGTRYVDLVLGHGSTTLPQGATIAGGPNSLTYGLPELLDTFDAPTRAALRSDLDALGAGFQQRGAQVNQTLQVLPTGLHNLQAFSQSILAQPSAATRFFPSLEQAASAFDAARAPFADAFGPTATGLQPFVDRRASMQQTLTQAPDTLAAAQTGLQQGTVLLAGARELSAGAAETLSIAPAGLNATTSLLNGSHEDLGQAATLLEQLQPTVPAALAITSHLQPTLAPLHQFFNVLGGPVTLLGKYGCDIENMLAGWRSTSGQATPGGDASGIGPLTTYRLDVIADAGSVAGPQLGFTSPGNVNTDTYPPPCTYSTPLPGGLP